MIETRIQLKYKSFQKNINILLMNVFTFVLKYINISL